MEHPMTATTPDLHDNRLADAWATLQSHSDKGLPRLAANQPDNL